MKSIEISDHHGEVLDAAAFLEGVTAAELVASLVDDLHEDDDVRQAMQARRHKKTRTLKAVP